MNRLKFLTGKQYVVLAPEENSFQIKITIKSDRLLKSTRKT